MGGDLIVLEMLVAILNIYMQEELNESTEV